MSDAKRPALRVEPIAVDDARVVALVRAHVAAAHAVTPPGSAHALDDAAMRTAPLRLYAAWVGDAIAGIGGLRPLEAGHFEIKSMYTDPARRRAGVADVILRALLDAARADGARRVSLETGAMDYFAPARALYTRHGFAVCGPYGSYRDDPNSVFMTLDLERR